MKEEKSLIEVNERKKGIKHIVKDLIEIIKSKANKNYILTENSPESLKKNRELIIRTIKKHYNYLDKVSEDILLEELKQEKLPVNGIIKTAFEKGYIINSQSAKIFLGENAKNAIIEYVEMQKKDESIKSIYNRNKSETIVNISMMLRYLDESILEDKKFEEKLINKIIEKNYKIDEESPKFIKNNDKLALMYYRDLLEKNKEEIVNSNIIDTSLLENKRFVEGYIDLLKEKGIDSETIIKTLTYNKECTDTFKSNLDVFQIYFEKLTPSNLKDFFDRFYSEQELSQVLQNKEKLYGKFSRFAEMYSKDKTIIETFNGKMLDERYKNIPEYKMEIITRIPEFQEMLSKLNQFQYSLYSKITQKIGENTGRWNRFERNIVRNLSDGYYDDLIKDMFEEGKNGNKISKEDIDTLTLLLSKENRYLKSNFEQWDKKDGLDDKQIGNEKINYSNNIFNITKKRELEVYDKIRELVCDTVLVNPKLDDEELTGPLNKYIKKFEQLDEIDRIKMALLEKYYNMDLVEAEKIVNSFSADIENIQPKDEYQTAIIEQIKAIKNIYECGDMKKLNEVGNLDTILETDLSTSTYLIEEAKDLYAEKYKDILYMPKNEETIGETEYNGKKIIMYDAGTDIAMITKTLNHLDSNSKEIWNKMNNSRGKLRYYTCTSYTTDENITKQNENKQVILGFGDSTKEYSFDGMFPADVGTPFERDMVYQDPVGSSYVLPSTLEMETDDRYNEIVINTIGFDENGKMKKMQPDYVLYVKENSDVELENMENDELWEKTKKTASEFEIPIVVVDKEKIKQSEKEKIAILSEKIIEDEDAKSIPKFVKKVEHYISRYGIEDILEYAPEKTIKIYKKIAEEEKNRKMKGKQVPNIENIIASELNREDLLKRQDEIKNTIGDEGR